MTTTPSDPTTALPGRPPVVDLATWQAARAELLVREKAYTREGDAVLVATMRARLGDSSATLPDDAAPPADGVLVIPARALCLLRRGAPLVQETAR